MAQDDTRAVELPATREVMINFERRARSRVRVPALTVLGHPEVGRVGEQALLEDLTQGRSLPLSRLDPTFAQPFPNAPRQPLADPYLSRKPLRLAAGDQHGSVRITNDDSPTDVAVNGQRLQDSCELSADDVDHGVVIELGRRIVLLLHRLSSPPPFSDAHLGLVGDSEAIARVRQDILRVADLDVSILLRGETGTGKELVARAIHEASRRRRATYLSVNVGAITPTLATSELFGSIKGSYTGATQNQQGYFLRAQGGTLFLDEIGEAPSEVQVMLLRVLESGEIQRVGAQEPQKVDVRLIAATDADLEAAIEQGTFKGPLLHRLASYEILMPPLRERRDDFGRLLFHFLRQELEEIGEAHRLDATNPADPPWMPASIVARLARFDWPGNIRQLRNIVRQLVIGSRGSEVVHVGPQVERLLNEVTANRRKATAAAIPEESTGSTRRPRNMSFRKPSEVTEEEMLRVLRENRWELKPAAEQLGISRASLYVLVEGSTKVRKASELSREEIVDGLEKYAGNLDALVDHFEVSKRGLQMRMKQLEMS